MTVICVPSRCSENQGPPSEIHRVCLLRSPSLEAADAAVPSQWPLQAPVEQRLIYQASGASRVVLRHEEEYLGALLPRPITGDIQEAPALIYQTVCCAIPPLLAITPVEHLGAPGPPPHRAPTAPMRPTAPPPPAPAAPSPLGGPASSARCLATLRSPPRPPRRNEPGR